MGTLTKKIEISKEAFIKELLSGNLRKDLVVTEDVIIENISNPDLNIHLKNTVFKGDLQIKNVIVCTIITSGIKSNNFLIQKTKAHDILCNGDTIVAQIIIEDCDIKMNVDFKGVSANRLELDKISPSFCSIYNNSTFNTILFRGDVRVSTCTIRNSTIKEKLYLNGMISKAVFILENNEIEGAVYYGNAKFKGRFETDNPNIAQTFVWWKSSGRTLQFDWREL